MATSLTDPGPPTGTAWLTTAPFFLAMLPRVSDKTVFALWLQSNRDNKNAVGRLAEFIGTRLPHTDERKKLRTVVEEAGAPREILRDFDVAWRIYRA
jgi:hypothetical protein